MVDTPEHLVPVTATISASAKSCSWSSNSLFTVTILYECSVGATILALSKNHACMANGVEIRDPTRNHRRIGPPGTWVMDEVSTEIDFTELVRLEPGQVIQKTYTFAVEPRSEGFGHSDIYNLEVGKTYELSIRRQKWWWRFEEDMDLESSENERKRILFAQTASEWKPDSTTTFVFTQ